MAIHFSIKLSLPDLIRQSYFKIVNLNLPIYNVIEIRAALIFLSGFLLYIMEVTMARDVKSIVSKMTLEEKASLCSGASFWDTKPVERVGIPSVMVSDGPHGLRKMNKDGTTVTSVCFPAACATASSFDTDLLEEMGDALGQQ